MSKSYYKVSFLESKKIDSIPLSLVFEKVNHSPSTSVIKELLLRLEDLNTKKKEILSIQNIKNVLELSNEFSLSKYTNFSLILLEYNKNDKKEGFLLANKKGEGMTLIGYWPFYSEKIFSSENFENKFKNILENINNLNKVLLVR